MPRGAPSTPYWHAAHAYLLQGFSTFLCRFSHYIKNIFKLASFHMITTLSAFCVSGKKTQLCVPIPENKLFVLFLKKKATDNKATFSFDYLRHAGDKSCY